MTSSTRASTQSGDRPSATGEGQQVVVRVHDPLLSALDAFAADQGDAPLTRPEAMRRAAADHLRARGYLPDAGPDEAPDAPATDRYTDADPDEGVMVTGVGPMTLRRAVRKHGDWRENHGLSLVSVYRGADKEPTTFDMADLGRLAETERFR